MRIKLYSIFVDDQTKALRFYTEVLGFVKAMEIPVGGGFRWLTVRSADGGDTQLSLEPDANPAARTYQRALLEQGIPATAFEVDDIVAEFERLKKLGVRIHGRTEASGPGEDRDLERHLRQPDSALSTSESRLTSLIVLRVLLVVGAEVLEQVVVGLRRELHGVGERPGVRARIVDRRLDLEVPRVGPSNGMSAATLIM